MTNTASKTVQMLDSIGLQSFQTDTERHEAMEAARRLLARLQTPYERTFTLTCAEPMTIAGVQMLQNLEVWKQWTEKHHQRGNNAQSLEDILDMCNVPVEPNLMRRFLRHLASSNVLEETAIDAWRLTPLTLAMGGDDTQHVDQTFKFATHAISSALHLPAFLAKHGYREPLDTAEFDNWTDVHGSKFFDDLQANPAVGASFAGLMTGMRNYKMDWTEVYDTTKLVSEADLGQEPFNEQTPRAPLFVDIGGLHGLDTARLVAKHPELPASTELVVQDLPEVVSDQQQHQPPLDPRIRRMAYDFFTPQPLVGARAYFFHAVPHDWPDADCVRILENVKAAMRRGYSKLLIYEMVIPVMGATSVMTTLDLQLMNCLSGLERTEDQWRRLLSGIGLEIVSISRHPRAVESVIEAGLGPPSK